MKKKCSRNCFSAFSVDIIKNTILPYLDFIDSHNLSLTCTMMNRLYDKPSFDTIVSSLSKESRKSVLKCEQTTIHSLYFAYIERCSLCFGKYVNGSFNRYSGIYAHVKCYKQFHGFHSIDLDSGQCKHVGNGCVAINSHFDEKKMFISGFRDMSVIVPNGSVVIKNYIEKLNLVSDPNFFTDHDLKIKLFLDEFRKIQQLSRVFVKPVVIWNKLSIDVVREFKPEIKTLLKSHTYESVKCFVFIKYKALADLSSTLLSMYQVHTKPLLINQNLHWYEFINKSHDDTQTLVNRFNILEGFDMDLYLSVITCQATIRHWNEKEMSRRINQKLQSNKILTTCPCASCIAYLSLPGYKRVKYFLRSHPEKSLDYLYDFFLDYYNKSWDYVFSIILSNPTIGGMLRNYVIGHDVFEKLLFPMSFESFDKQHTKLLYLLETYDIKDIRKVAIEKQKSDNIMNLEAKIIEQKTSRKRCCSFQFRKSCKFKLCDVCCNDPKCTHHDFGYESELEDKVEEVETDEYSDDEDI